MTSRGPFQPFQIFRRLQSPLAGGLGLRQPIFLTKSDGTVFVTAEGNVLVRGYRTVQPVE